MRNVQSDLNASLNELLERKRISLNQRVLERSCINQVLTRSSRPTYLEAVEDVIAVAKTKICRNLVFMGASRSSAPGLGRSFSRRWAGI